MTAARRRIFMEVCSGADDGETFCTEMPFFTIGTTEACSLRTTDSAVPEQVKFELRERAGGEVLVSSEPFLHENQSVSEIEISELPCMIRLGFTDIYLALEGFEEYGEADAGDEDRAGANGDSGDMEELLRSLEEFGLDSSILGEDSVTLVCGHCGMVNEPGSTWCIRCGWDLMK